MAGVSLQCGECGTVLKSVEEAEEHAKLTNHLNFSESIEPVLNLVCSTCHKPCRSKTGSDLHTKRTGHIEFVDKTAEMIKPISLEAPKILGSSDGDMVDVVDSKLIEQFEAMGFPNERIKLMTQVAKIKADAAKRFLTLEEKMIKVSELLDRARKEKEEDEKRKEILKSMKLHEAKRIEAEKRFMALWEAEKEKSAREKIRQKLKED